MEQNKDPAGGGECEKAVGGPVRWCSVNTGLNPFTTTRYYNNVNI